MKTTQLTFIGVILCVISLHAFRIMQQSNITGIVVPLNSSPEIIAINGIDSLRTKATNGNFSLQVRPGNWKVIVESQSPDPVTLNVMVPEAKTIDVGIIRLQ